MRHSGFMSFVFGDQQCLDPVALRDSYAAASPRLPTDWFGKANRYICPLSMAPGSGHILLSKTSLDALDLSTKHKLLIVDVLYGVINPRIRRST